MIDAVSEILTKSKLSRLRETWSTPDKDQAQAWEIDGVYETNDRKSYDQEMSEGLEGFGCKTFDALVLWIGKKIGRKPNVIDYMGGAYFIHSPENTNSITGIRILNKDEALISSATDNDDLKKELLTKITQSPNRKVVEADILTHEGRNIIKNQNLPLADLLVCRPVGPFDLNRAMGSRNDSPESFVRLYTALFNQMLSLVNRDDGIIFSEVPDIYSDEEIKKFFVNIDKNEGSYSWLFTLKDENKHWGGATRRYAVVQFKKSR